MRACLLVIQECERGIAIEQIPIPGKATKLETDIAGLMDIALKTAQEFVAKCCRNGTMIEGTGLEKRMTAELESIGAVSVRKAIAEAGYEISN